MVLTAFRNWMVRVQFTDLVGNFVIRHQQVVHEIRNEIPHHYGFGGN